MDSVNFKVAEEDRQLIRKIAARAVKLDGGLSRLSVQMDLTATHANGNPLRLQDMLVASNFSLMHDVYGIARRLDRDTGELTGHFRPRFSRRDEAGA